MKFVSKLLNFDQTYHRVNIAKELLDSASDAPPLLYKSHRFMVMTWKPKLNDPNGRKLVHETRPQNARHVRSNVNVLLIIFFDFRGMVHHEF